jgi:hypothetical protein
MQIASNKRRRRRRRRKRRALSSALDAAFWTRVINYYLVQQLYGSSSQSINIYIYIKQFEKRRIIDKRLLFF